jgi:6-phosphogluconolactonase (cycloisomerase 2 family)
VTSAHQPLVYIGNWDRHKSPPSNGFGIFRFNAEHGALSQVGAAAPNITVGAACIHPQRPVLYCVDEYTTLPGNFLGGGGQIHAFDIEPQTGALHEINHLASFGALPSSLTTDATGRFLVATHHTDRTPVTKIKRGADGRYDVDLVYDDATTVLFPLAENGAIGEPCDLFTHSGSGGPLPRQTHPQLHSITRSPSGRLFVVCDKGNDELVVFGIDPSTRALRRLSDPYKAPAGSSPRYVAFHAKKPWLFVNHETAAVVSAVRYDETGALTCINTVCALPGTQPDNMQMKQSDILLHPSGKHLYSMIRGISSIAVFEIDQTSGAIERVDTVALDAAGPRGGAFSPDGRYLIVAAWEGKEVTVWNVDSNGALTPTGHKLQQPNPGSVTIYWTGAA